jgi:hypothetical protein
MLKKKLVGVVSGLLVAVLVGSPVSSQAVVSKPAFENRPSSSNLYSYRFVGEVLQRKGNRDRSWTSKSVKALPVTSVRALAFKAIKESAAGQQSVEVNYVVGKNVPKAMVSAYQRQMRHALSFYDFSGLQRPLDILIYSERDAAVMTSYWQPRWAGEEQIASKSRILDSLRRNGVNISVSGSSEVRQLKDGSYPTLGIDFQIGSRHTQERHLLVELVAHEMAHAWQFHVIGLPEKVAANQPFDLVGLLPCHALEGAANTLGISVAVKYDDWYAEAADVIIRRTARDAKIKKMSDELAVQLLKKSESWATCDEGYAIGMLAYEWLVSKYGTAKFYDIYREIGKGKTFATIMPELFGITVDEFYAQAAPHITATFNNALKK